MGIRQRAADNRAAEEATVERTTELAATVVAACPDPEHHYRMASSHEPPMFGKASTVQTHQKQLNEMYVKGYRAVQSFNPDAGVFVTVYEHHFH
jgi:hypothetical protein